MQVGADDGSDSDTVVGADDGSDSDTVVAVLTVGDQEILGIF